MEVGVGGGGGAVQVRHYGFDHCKGPRKAQKLKKRKEKKKSKPDGKKKLAFPRSHVAGNQAGLVL